jgi:uncharacterized protein YecE (DUF72 family)
MKMLFGCAGVRGAIDNYAKRFEMVEVDPLEGRAKAKPGSLKRWRKEAGPALAFSIVAPKALALVRPGPALDAALADLLEAQRALQARWILLLTPIEVTPAPLQRERIAKVVERIREGLGDARTVVRIAWAPRGMWEMADAATLALSLDLDLACDPLTDPREPFWHETLRYVRIGPVGGRTAYPPARLRALAEALVEDSGGEGERVVVLTTPKAPAEAKRLKSLVKALTEEAGGGDDTFSPPGRGEDDEE